MELKETHQYELQVFTEPNLNHAQYPRDKGIMKLEAHGGQPRLGFGLPEGEFNLSRPQYVYILLRLQSIEGVPYEIDPDVLDQVNGTTIVHDGKISCRESVLLQGKASFHFYIRENKLVPCRTTNYAEYDNFVYNLKEK